MTSSPICDRKLAAIAAIEQFAGANRDDFAALRLFFGRVGQHDAAGGASSASTVQRQHDHRADARLTLAM